MPEQIKFDIDGETVTISPAVLQGYYNEASEYLGAEADAKRDFKDVIETVSETTKLPKRIVSKYFKAKYKEATAADKEIGEVFGFLDDALAVKKEAA